MKTVHQPAQAFVLLLVAVTALWAEAACPPALLVMRGAQRVSCGPLEGSIQDERHLSVAGLLRGIASAELVRSLPGGA